MHLVRPGWMKRGKPVLLLITLPFLFFSGCAGPAVSSQNQATGTPTGKITLNVSAAASLTDVLNPVDSLYTQSNPGVQISPNYASSGTLQQQIEQGAPCDVFISAGAAQMDKLQSEGLIVTGTRRVLLNNTLVLVVPEDSTLGLTSFNDLTSAKVGKVAIGDPASVPAGNYAIQAFDALGITAQVKPKEVLGNDVRQVLEYVETGNVEAGIVYLTDAMTSNKVKVVASAPAQINARIEYPVAVTSSSHNQKTAQDYIAFLSGAQAKAIFEKYGFAVAGK